MKFIFEFDEQDLAIINELVGEGKYKVVAPLVAKMNEQIQGQIKQKEQNEQDS